MGYHALIIEDDIDIAHILSLTLTKMHIKTTLNFSGQEAIETLEKDQFDLILLDLMLPEVSGEEVLSYIKAHANSRVVVISAKTDVEEKVRLLSSGADDYLTKPFDTKELAAWIDVQLRNLQQMPRQGDILTWRDLTIDKQTRKVQVKNQVLNVTNTEYDILCLFMLTPEQPISKQKIYENIQGIYLGDDNTVNVHISNIRKKLAAFSDESYIKTVWGIGFMLE